MSINRHVALSSSFNIKKIAVILPLVYAETNNPCWASISQGMRWRRRQWQPARVYGHIRSISGIGTHDVNWPSVQSQMRGLLESKTATVCWLTDQNRILSVGKTVSGQLKKETAKRICVMSRCGNLEIVFCQSQFSLLSSRPDTQHVARELASFL